ncbi:MAG: flagellar basal body rod protein FlgB [Nitrospinae bacterium]|nr:flagellar basal body rod protein FlgB [Nitrospinota bacterium]
MGDIFRIREFGYLQKGMDMLSTRQNATAANIANAETPGYKAVNVNFENNLAAAMGKGFTMTETNPRHMPTAGKGIYGVKPEMNQTIEGGRMDGNTVNVDHEVNDMLATRIGYQTMITAFNKKSGEIITAIESGK